MLLITPKKKFLFFYLIINSKNYFLLEVKLISSIDFYLHSY
ncbi:hypothetical protein EV03_1992 [Prochlorococcus marinus str. PAC1]|uniref:Uncharacterized protein n=1 Tax=Prochlorococcus marinus str. PAC1 TaxID=59924 RepID=A0A0A2C289_PROMR|nr:hypothetical protein EV03_1992 [Prochlorococcus marinus str. PAC1]